MEASRATIRFYAELNDFVAPRRRGRASEIRFYVPPRAKDAIEGLGVPHTEIELILVNGEPAGFDRPVRDGDRVAVYPMFESIDVRPVLRLRPEPLRRLRFVLDDHLGRLAAYLRMLGLDARYDPPGRDGDLAGISRREGRVLLTRDVGLLKRGAVTHGYFVRETQPRRQLAEVVRRFDLAGDVRPFTRCLRCNGVLAAASAEEAAARAPAAVRERHREFQRCPGCGRLFWPGTHHRRMQEILREALEER